MACCFTTSFASLPRRILHFQHKSIPVGSTAPLNFSSMDELEPVAGPSQSASRSVNIQKLDLIDVDNLDWKLYEGTYKGTSHLQAACS